MSGRGDGGWLAALVPQPGPRTRAAATAWLTLDEPTRHRLRLAATDPRLARSLTSVAERLVVRDLAASRAERRVADVAGPLVTGLLVLSTLWGFGRAAQPDAAGWWLVAGLVGLVATTVVGMRRAAARRHAATEALAAVRDAADRADGGFGGPLR